MIYSLQQINQVSKYVTNLFINNQHEAPFLIYHNLLHTQHVVARTNEIAGYYSLQETELAVVLCAAWFHDCGHLFGSAIDHELRSVIKMREYMEAIETAEGVIQWIEACILSTKIPGNPETLLEKILCDADLYHFGTDDFFVTDKLVKKEYELRNNFLPLNWDEATLDLLKQHHFYTKYCNDLLMAGKIKNINSLQNKINSKN